MTTLLIILLLVVIILLVAIVFQRKRILKEIDEIDNALSDGFDKAHFMFKLHSDRIKKLNDDLTEHIESHAGIKSFAETVDDVAMASANYRNMKQEIIELRGLIGKVDLKNNRRYKRTTEKITKLYEHETIAEETTIKIEPPIFRPEI